VSRLSEKKIAEALDELKRRYHEDQVAWTKTERALRSRAEEAEHRLKEARNELGASKARHAEEIENHLMDALAIVEKAVQAAREAREGWATLSKDERDAEARSVRLWAHPFVGEAMVEVRERLLALVEERIDRARSLS